MPDTNRRIALSLLLAVGMAILTTAQEPEAQPEAKTQAKEETKESEPREERRRKGLSPGQVLVLRFDRAAPQIGDPLPDVTGFDEQGRQFELQSLKGQYSVLTFGCLT